MGQHVSILAMDFCAIVSLATLALCVKATSTNALQNLVKTALRAMMV
jgi:hypothetical protein